MAVNGEREAAAAQECSCARLLPGSGQLVCEEKEKSQQANPPGLQEWQKTSCSACQAQQCQKSQQLPDRQQLQSRVRVDRLITFQLVEGGKAQEMDTGRYNSHYK